MTRAVAPWKIIPARRADLYCLGASEDELWQHMQINHLCQRFVNQVTFVLRGQGQLVMAASEEYLGPHLQANLSPCESEAQP